MRQLRFIDIEVASFSLDSEVMSVVLKGIGGGRVIDIQPPLGKRTWEKFGEWCESSPVVQLADDASRLRRSVEGWRTLCDSKAEEIKILQARVEELEAKCRNRGKCGCADSLQRLSEE